MDVNKFINQYTFEGHRGKKMAVAFITMNEYRNVPHLAIILVAKN